MYTVMNRIPVRAAGGAAFEERFAANVRETLPGVAGLIGARLPRVTRDMSETVAAVGA